MNYSVIMPTSMRIMYFWKTRGKVLYVFHYVSEVWQRVRAVSRAVMSICESPSNITWSKPVSRANSRALLVAIASTSMAMKGSMVFCKRETMTCPISFRITTTIPALFSYANRAPSKFTLYISLSGGCQQVGGHPTSIMVEELWRLNSRNLSFAWDNSWPRGTVDFPSWRLFLRFHITKKKKAWIPVNSIGNVFDCWIRNLDFNPCLHQKLICILVWW